MRREYNKFYCNNRNERQVFTKFTSLANSGRIKELEESTKWVPTYSLIERIKKQEAKLRKEAVKIVKRKDDTKDIIELTGLSKTEIYKL